MGEMADAALNEIFDVMELEDSGLMREISPPEDSDYHASTWWGNGNRPAPKTCRCCKTGGLHWGMVGPKWRLFTDNGKLHECPVNPLK